MWGPGWSWPGCVWACVLLAAHTSTTAMRTFIPGSGDGDIDGEMNQERTRSALLVLQEKLAAQADDMRLLKNEVRKLQGRTSSDKGRLEALHTTVSDSNWAMADLKLSLDRLHNDVLHLKGQQETLNETLWEIRSEGQRRDAEYASAINSLTQEVKRVKEHQRNDRHILQRLRNNNSNGRVTSGGSYGNTLDFSSGNIGIESSGDSSNEDQLYSRIEESNNEIGGIVVTTSSSRQQQRQLTHLERELSEQQEQLASVVAFTGEVSQQLEQLRTATESPPGVATLTQSLTNFTQQVARLEALQAPSTPQQGMSTMNSSTVENHQARIALLEELVVEYRDVQVGRDSSMKRQMHKTNSTITKLKDKLHNMQRELDRGLRKLKDQVIQSNRDVLNTQRSVGELSSRVTNTSLNTCSKSTRDEHQDARLAKYENNAQTLDKRISNQQSDIDRMERGVSRLSSSMDSTMRDIQEALTHGQMVSSILPLAQTLQHEVANLVWQLPPDCTAAQPGVTLLRPTRGTASVRVYCAPGDGHTWTVIQRRLDGNVDFSRTWEEYRQGFGDPAGEFWMGTEGLHYLTTQADYLLHIDMWDLSGVYSYATYDYFKVDEPSTHFRLHVDGYQGNATDALSYSNFMPFSTQDQDNDASSTHCAKFYTAGWWYKHCHYSNLNGRYALGIVWFNQEIDEWVQMQHVEMRLRLHDPHKRTNTTQ